MNALLSITGTPLNALLFMEHHECTTVICPVLESRAFMRIYTDIEHSWVSQCHECSMLQPWNTHKCSGLQHWNTHECSRAPLSALGEPWMLNVCVDSHECSALQLPFCLRFPSVACLGSACSDSSTKQAVQVLGQSFSSSHISVSVYLSLCSWWKLLWFVLFWNSCVFLSEWVHGASLDRGCEPLARRWVCLTWLQLFSAEFQCCAALAVWRPWMETQMGTCGWLN